MRIAGICVDGRLVWADAGEIELRALDVAEVLIGGERRGGIVLVTPEQLMGMPPVAEGEVVQARKRVGAKDECVELPGAEMPPLGSEMDGGVVVGIDAAKRTATIERVDGSKETRTM